MVFSLLVELVARLAVELVIKLVITPVELVSHSAYTGNLCM